VTCRTSTINDVAEEQHLDWHTVTAAGGNICRYDLNGNMTNRNGYAIYGTAENYLTQLSITNEAQTFSYCPDNQRWRQAV
jgi:hypothetical protein